MTAQDGGLVQIGELAERTGLSLRTIRHYDEEGLLTPTSRSAGGFRLYSPADEDRLMVIKRMKPLGFSIDRMRDLLDVVDRLQRTEVPGEDDPGLRERLRALVAEAVERRDALRARVALAEQFVEQLHQLDPG